jgi:hypothetical protein
VKTNGAEALLMANVPYFNRTWEHFSSHKHTPSAGKAGYPAATRKGNLIYFMHPLFTQYARTAPRWCRELFLNAVVMLLPDPVVRMEGAPTATIATLNRQEGKKRDVLHLLHYVPERRGAEFDVVEDIYPLMNLMADVRVPGKIRKVTLVPEGKNLAFKQQGSRVTFSIPELNGHGMVELAWG